MALRMFLTPAVVVLSLVGPPGLAARAGQGDTLDVRLTQNTRTVPAYEVFEITFEHDNQYANPFFDVTIEVRFTSPSGRKLTVGGFHYGSSSGPSIIKHPGDRPRVTYRFDKSNLWKARLAPDEPGNWSYSFTFTGPHGRTASGQGTFRCVRGRKPAHGFLRLNPANKFTFVHDDGSPFFGIGLQDCWGDNSGTGSVLDQCSMEGPFRTDLKAPPPLPEGPLFVRGPSCNPQNADVYFRRFSRCGFNLYRFSQISLIFWNTSYARDGHYMNIWLGPQDREYIRALQDFAYRLDKDVRPVAVEVSDPKAVRAYALASSERLGLYLHHFNNHDRPAENIKVTLDVPRPGKAYWYCPQTADILATVDAKPGPQTFEAPPFTVDLALLVTPDGPPDIDRDGLPNHLDGDGIGDNADPDDDNDGWSDLQEARRNTDPADKLDFPDEPQPVRYMIIVTGSELLAGAYPDAHTHFLTSTLRPLGLHCTGSMTVEDDPAALKDALRFARSKAELIIVTGGLGPTDNDLTRQVLAECTGIALKEQPEVLNRMAGRFGVNAKDLRPNLRRQALVPSRGTYFSNPNGTAVGLVFELDRTVIVALPGPPRELRPMVTSRLIPYLARRFGTRSSACSVTIRFVGLGQSQIDQTIANHIPLDPDITTSSRFEDARVDFTFSLPDDTPQNRARLADLKRKILHYLGDNVYATDATSLEQHVLRLLSQKGQRIAVAEAGSGCLSAALTAADGAENAVAGAFAAPTLAKLERLLATPKQAGQTPGRLTLEQLARTLAHRTGSHWAIVVALPQKTQTPGNYAQTALRLPDGSVQSRRIRLRGSGESARRALTTQLLELLRRQLK